MKLLKQIEDPFFTAKEPRELGSMADEFEAFVTEYINPGLTRKDFEEQITYDSLEGELKVLWEVYCAGIRFSNDRQAFFESERKKAEQAKPFEYQRLPLGLALVNGKVQPTYGKHILNVETCNLVQNHSEVIATCTFRVSSIQNEKDA